MARDNEGGFSFLVSNTVLSSFPSLAEGGPEQNPQWITKEEVDVQGERGGKCACD